MLNETLHNVTIVGAGLSGCEIALQLSERGYDVILYDAKPSKILPVYEFASYGELVCNNSFGPTNVHTPLGQLLFELKQMGSRVIGIAEQCRLKDEKYFSIDKKMFSTLMTASLQRHNIEIKNEELLNLPSGDTIIIATGPLTNASLLADISSKFRIDEYHFSDASSVIVNINSIDIQNNNIKKITEDLFSVSIPIPLFENFYKALISSTPHAAHSVDMALFDKCQTIESLAEDGLEKLYNARFMHEYVMGPCLLLRRETALENAFIMVGCMTTLSHLAQREIFSMLPGFANVEILKYGRMHRNTFFNSPKTLNVFYKINDCDAYIIGQLSGIDGYLPAISSGVVATLRVICGDTLKAFPNDTMIGALAHYVSNETTVDFQPMCASYSLLKNINEDYCINSFLSIKNYKEYLSKFFGVSK